MTLDNERLKKLTAATRELAQHIGWLLPFLDKKAKESGDIAGIQENARDAADRARKLLNWMEVEDAIKANELSKSALLNAGPGQTGGKSSPEGKSLHEKYDGNGRPRENGGFCS